MKKFIAAALSVLVGAFGYTIVDSTIEDRVSRLESEVYELREEVSDYHNENISSESSAEQDGIYVGKNFKDAGSRYKFLIRIYDDGLVEYISPENYIPRNGVTMRVASFEESNTEIHLDDPRVPNTNSTYTEDDYQSTDIGLSDPRETTRPNHWVTGWYEEYSSFYSTATPGDYFVYLDTVSAVVTDADFETKHYYDSDYSLASKSLCSEFTFTITYQGKTDPALAGEKIKFDTSFFDGYGVSPYVNVIISNNTINSDGSFKYTETYIVNKSEFISDYIPFVNFNYSVYSAKLS